METGISRRGLFGAGAAAAAILAGAPGLARAASGMTLRWWGNNGWEIRIGAKTILIDPWLTRFKTGTYTSAGADPHTPLSVNKALIDGYLDRGYLHADHILVTHGHYDHLTDVPYLAERTGATVIGTETHLSLMAALGAPEDQLSIATGGEDLTFDGYTIRVLRSLHSATGPRARVAFPGTRSLSRRDRPRVIADLLEGGTLAYVVSGGGASVLDFGGANYIESELAGLRPDVVLLPPGGAKVTDYVPRLLRVLGNPRCVAATHWDDFDLPLGRAHDPNGGLEVLRKAVAAASPGSEFVVLDHLGEFTP
ncbi:MBL fold metallo-hydrolase [Amycolatopsis sp. Hca4]|uniref:MBL fold metallo-hydrolase n=1 Tax=Amycolatopsis sp. Hca4 TaxID=2742131 RepID=UPI0015928380|nr:MBL fold metallo-hydrolase [Amycolatopsis sp. Hca4]QKV78988.1 MBL fold metallo-hydrolase [Amycolatopsis sp. Hca4]